MVRPSPPRFLNYGDQCQMPVVLQNQTDAEMRVQLAARSHNATLTADSSRAVTVPARDRVRILLPVAAAKPGRAHFQIAVAADEASDAAQFSLPVWTPATTEAFAEYGVLDEGALSQAVRVPSNAEPSFGALSVTTSSTALHALGDAVLYLSDYPYACAEQIASRMLAIAALREMLPAFGGEWDAEKVATTITADMKVLQQIQNQDGGFGFWRRGERSWPYVSVHVAHAMTRARDLDLAGAPHALERALGYLRQIKRHLASLNYPESARFTIEAYALWVRDLAGQDVRAEADKLIADKPMDQRPLEALGWLLNLAGPTNAVAIKRHLQNRVTETAASATFTTHYGDGEYLLLYSSRRGDGIILENLIEAEPKSDLIPKVVAGLMAGRHQGRWRNTQENVFILLALERYFRTYERVTPDFVARVWLGDGLAAETQYAGRDTERNRVTVPMNWLAEHPQSDQLILAKQGTGRLYYRLGLDYAPKSLDLAAESQGFYVERSYQAVDDGNDVTRREDGTWVIKAGSRVRVSLTMVAPARRTHIALVDPLPAGLEALNLALPVTAGGPEVQVETDSGRRRWWYRPWYEHQNVRDERIEAFTTQLWAGVHRFSYVARATTPGSFIVPPTKAEEMYQPETFGRSATDRVEIILEN
jgi:hypothetical protein